MLDLEPIKARLRAATPGPWEIWLDTMGRGKLWHTVTRRRNGPVVCRTGAQGMPGSAEDAAFIAAAPADVEALVAEVERLRAACHVVEAYFSGSILGPQERAVVANVRAALGEAE